MMEAHWRSSVRPHRVEGIGAFNENRDPVFQISGYWKERASVPKETNDVDLTDDLE